jgi:hypothetical protein
VAKKIGRTEVLVRAAVFLMMMMTTTTTTTTTFEFLQFDVELQVIYP